MTFKATDNAVSIMNERKISPKDIMVDKNIMLRNGNPLYKQYYVKIRIESDDVISIFHALDEYEDEVFDVECIMGHWKRK